MIVQTIISPCWQASPSALASSVSHLENLLQHAPDETELFFRADDIGVPSKNCRHMLALFARHHIPLHLAVTPAWLSETRWQILREWAGKEDSLWIWHQHGWRHQNHQKSGKKGEFGQDRSSEAKQADIIKGREKLIGLMGTDFAPVFTPPWNRFDTVTGGILAEAGYRAVSRSVGEMKKVPLPACLPDYAINVDLHTRSEALPQNGLQTLLDEFRQAMDSGRIGIMLHHQRMNDASFSFLDSLLSLAKKIKRFKLTTL